MGGNRSALADAKKTIPSNSIARKLMCPLIIGLFSVVQGLKLNLAIRHNLQ